jgi:hypothetical protein
MNIILYVVLRFENFVSRSERSPETGDGEEQGSEQNTEGGGV